MPIRIGIWRFYLMVIRIWIRRFHFDVDPDPDMARQFSFFDADPVLDLALQF
jgi:hypothetical protein